MAMLYREYTEKIKRYAEIRDRILKYKILIICALALILAAWTGFLITKGMILEDVSGDDSYVYGDGVSFDAKALFTRARLEYAEAGSESWSEQVPVMPGEYKVRVMAKQSFGRRNYGEPLPFTISKREATVTVVSTIEWLEEPRPVARGLAEGDRVAEADITLDSTNVGTTSATIGADSVRIVNAEGNNVTAAYILTVSDASVDITPRRITVRANDTSKIYDGMPASAAGYKIISGSLAPSHTSVADYFFNDGVNVGTHDIMLTGFKVYSGGSDVTANYSVSVEAGKAVITPRKVRVVTETVSKLYDGEMLYSSPSCFPADDSGLSEALAPGERATFSCRSIVDVTRDSSGEVQGVEAEAKLLVSREGTYVTSNYEIEYVFGTITILPRPLTVQADNYSKKYDGYGITPVEGTDFRVTDGSVLSGHYIEAEINGDSVNASDTPHKYTLEVKVMSGNEDKTDNYDIRVSYAGGSQYGTVSISHRVITVSTGSYTWTYDGEYHSTLDYTIVGDGLADTDYYKSQEPVSIKDAGSIQHTVTLKIYNKRLGSDATSNYKISYGSMGTLTVVRRPITIHSGTASKIYDTTPLFSTVATSEQLVYGHRISVTSHSQITDVLRNADGEVGSIDNVITAEIFDGAENVTRNYIITYVYGKLTVEPRPLIIIANSAEKIYDRLTLTDGGYTLGGQGLAISEHKFNDNAFIISGKRTAVGSALNKITQLSNRVVSDGNGDDITQNYEIRLSDGMLTVLPLTNFFEPDYMGKEYDGEALTATDGSHVGGDGTLYGDGIIYIGAAGSQIYAGQGASYIRLVVIKDEYGYTVAVNNAGNMYTVHAAFIDSTSPMYISIPNDGTAGGQYQYVRIYPDGRVDTCVTSSYMKGNYSDTYINRDGETVSESYYDFDLLDGVLNVRPRKVTVSTGSATQAYREGATLTESSWRISQGSMVSGHHLTVGTTGTATEKGVPVKNTVDLENIIISDDLGNDITGEVRDSYEFSAIEGTLLLE
ncbi:MAG: hypothetical protein IJY08_01070 [Clostridia bacterium]|nr:hypothetical protein [Clostridia bacterium]